MSRNVSLLFVSLLLGSQLVLAQGTTGTISGVVRDATSAVIPGATVTVMNVDTGITRTVSTDDRGRYHAPNLTLGNYEVQAQLSGFQTGLRSGIRLTVGQEAVVNFTLQVGDVTESVEVVGEAPLVDTTSSAVTGLVDDRTIRDLPLNGRSFDQLVLLQAGALGARRATDPGSFLGGGSKISISGARPQQNSFLLDGSDVNDPRNAMPGSVAGVLLGVETVREFRVLTNSYSAEFGRAAGGTITAVTRSGTNELHGTVFEFHRNDDLDARNFFDDEVPPFVRNQYGFTAGGPIKKNKTFFFGSYEGLRDRLGVTEISPVPNAAARQGILPSGNVTIASGVKPWLDLYPLPNGRDFGNGIGEHIFGSSRSTDEDYFLVRVDHTLSSNHSAFFRYNFDDAERSLPSDLPIENTVTASRNQYSTLEVDSILSAATLNAFRFSYNRSTAKEGEVFSGGFPSGLTFVPGVPFEVGGLLNVTGIASIGNQRTPQQWSQNMFEVSDDVTYIRGRHTFKTGFNFKRIRLNRFSTNSGAGTYRFTSGLSAFLRGQPQQFLALIPGKDPNRGLRMALVSFYAQDDFKVSPNLTLNLGLREEFMTSPNEVNGRCSSLPDIMEDSTTVGCPFFETFKNNLAPRFGFAWDSRGNGKLVVRGGFGLFYDQPLPTYWLTGPTQLPPFFGVATLRGTLPFPNAFERVDPNQPIFGDLRTFVLTGTTYAMQYNLTVQSEVAPGTALTVGYAGSQGRKLVRTGQINTRIPAILPDGRQCFNTASGAVNPSCPNADRDVRNPTWGNIRAMITDANSNYNALIVKVEKRLRSGLRLQGVYNYSKIMSVNESVLGADFSSVGGEHQIMDPYNPRADRAPAGYSLKHNFVVSYTYDLPLRLEGAAGKILGGWQVSGVTSLASGAPSPIVSQFGSDNGSRGSSINERPNLVAGTTDNPVEGASAGCETVDAGQKLGGADRYFDPCVFGNGPRGFYGTLGRNTMVGPGLAVFDFSLTKNTSITERTNLQFRAEFFNLFNHTNLATPAPTVFSSSGARVGDAGRITSTSTSSRQIQLSLKFVF